MSPYLIVTAIFHPQTWVDDAALDVDAPGEQRWDCSAAFAALPETVQRRALARMDDGRRDADVDALRHDPNAPPWVAEWPGPFAIELHAVPAWRARLTETARSLGDASVEFHTWRKVLSARNGQRVAIVEPLVTPNAPFDEEALPYILVRFADGEEEFADTSELFSFDPRVLAFLGAVNAPFAVARELGYVGPSHLHHEAHAHVRNDFESRVAASTMDAPEQAPHTPAKFRVATGTSGART